jgi:hypothetical protein
VCERERETKEVGSCINESQMCAELNVNFSTKCQVQLRMQKFFNSICSQGDHSHLFLLHYYYFYESRESEREIFNGQ